MALAFLWTETILRDDLNVYQFVGCAVIVVGSSTVLVLKGMEERRLLAREKGAAASAGAGYVYRLPCGLPTTNHFPPLSASITE